ncbi:MAG TPA: YgjV family protein [Azospirillum sp.]
MPDILSAATLAQIVGFAGTLAGVAWALFRGRVAMLTVQLAASTLFALHFALLGAPTGSLMNVLATVQAAAAIPLGTRPGFRYVYLAVLPLIAAGLAATWHGLPSAFAAAGLAFVSLGRYQTDVRLFRLFMALALPCWFGHNLLVMSVPGMLSDAAAMTVNAVMLARLVRPGRAAVGASGRA